MYYSSSENKGADQLHDYCESGQCLCFLIGKNMVFSLRSLNKIILVSQGIGI